MNNQNVQTQINLRQEPLRAGMWTVEEIQYVAALIQEFRAGSLELENGSTLRAFLADRCRCNVKRISKKLEGSEYNGRKSYRMATHFTPEELVFRRARLGVLRERFWLSIENLKCLDEARKGKCAWPKNTAMLNADTQLALATSVPRAVPAPDSSKILEGAMALSLLSTPDTRNGNELVHQQHYTSVAAAAGAAGSPTLIPNGSVTLHNSFLGIQNPSTVNFQRQILMPRSVTSSSSSPVTSRLATPSFATGTFSTSIGHWGLTTSPDIRRLIDQVIRQRPSPNLFQDLVDNHLQRTQQSGLLQGVVVNDTSSSAKRRVSGQWEQHDSSFLGQTFKRSRFI